MYKVILAIKNNRINLSFWDKCILIFLGALVVVFYAGLKARAQSFGNPPYDYLIQKQVSNVPYDYLNMNYAYNQAYTIFPLNVNYRTPFIVSSRAWSYGVSFPMQWFDIPVVYDYKPLIGSTTASYDSIPQTPYVIPEYSNYDDSSFFRESFTLSSTVSVWVRMLKQAACGCNYMSYGWLGIEPAPPLSSFSLAPYFTERSPH